LQEELTATENKIGFSRQLYNDTATQYNTAQQTFPTMLFAGMAGATQVPLWEITEEIERAVPHVDLSMGPPKQSLPGQVGQRSLGSPPDTKV
jgi:LemA protein